MFEYGRIRGLSVVTSQSPIKRVLYFLFFFFKSCKIRSSNFRIPFPPFFFTLFFSPFFFFKEKKLFFSIEFGSMKKSNLKWTVHFEWFYTITSYLYCDWISCKINAILCIFGIFRLDFSFLRPQTNIQELE